MRAGAQSTKLLEQKLAALNATQVHIGLFDIEGTFRHKLVDAGKAVKLAAEGYPFCEVLYKWDIAEETYGSATYIDRPAFLDESTVRSFPFAPGQAVVIADFEEPFGQLSPRNQLLRQLELAADMGFSVFSALEFEFVLFDETPDSVREKGFTGLNAFAKANRTYSLSSAALYSDLLAGLRDTMTKLGVAIDALHTELGPGCFEAPLTYAEGIKAADDAALFKNFAKAYFLRNGLMAGFMSKMSPDLPGQSGHLHLSLRDRDGRPVFSDPSRPDGLSETSLYFIGGLTKLMPELLAMCSHTVNAYKRIVPGSWAPTASSWGVQNRTAAVRIINDQPMATRLEFRVPSADTNPYLALSLCLAAGLWGIRNRIMPDAGGTHDFYASEPAPSARLPRDLRDAAERFGESAVARELFGEAFVENFTSSRLHEAAAYARQISPWEVRRYLEVV